MATLTMRLKHTMSCARFEFGCACIRTVLFTFMYTLTDGYGSRYSNLVPQEARSSLVPPEARQRLSLDYGPPQKVDKK